ncbi:similar to Saccharomyces cerevisiae YBR121C GRS1 Cytoplasmic and mitochondrial glycyl-tRNA synthase that ligates glycine to the cognate anticodon bearing tRNA [Maudiozyma saulgeensis]|uniref:glycine--tRNA ligase n=1 Tax=Maudiozyma saulgeensis TaxID=1789683 RepID=A0A1X7QX46_9SACH|nr:similar to Saccharomyces cerevisiae YBR121C GRS1 Cytoplasmic and mitochondrial glycyl-tRNA synthase that ligates glycine to the cognate anticodon bearing tRNA [Kazachstania saulgeensis]
MTATEVQKARAASVFNRESLESILRGRFFYAPAFDIYGGVSGLYDYGPPGCAFQANVVDTWRKHFILEEDMLEVDCTMLTPYEVLKTSGHVDKFSDWMCRDLKTGEIFRADHLVEEVLEARLKGDKEARGIAADPEEEESADKKKRKKKVKQIKAIKLEDDVAKEYEMVLAKIDGYSGEELGELMVKYSINNPATDGPLEPPMAFNLMFETAIGPSGQLRGFLRPETAQGQFLNFNKLLEFNNSKTPFASASIGKSFRNEISPRAGLLRVREFLMAEIEHFVDPMDKSHPKFGDVKDITLSFLPRGVQEAGSTVPITETIGKAVESKMIDNETLGYFIGRIYQFLVKIGVDKTKLRFRQHMGNEMAHYATDCWDGELLTSYGWIECVGCADRSAFDLTVHSNKTKEKMVVREKLETPIEVTKYEIDLTKKLFGPKFRKDAPLVEKFLLDLSQTELEAKASELKSNGKVVFQINGIEGDVELDDKFINIEKRTKVEHVREYVPNVIEPSFGIGRIIYAVFEHSFWNRPEDTARGVLSFPPLVAPSKVLLVPLSNNKELQPVTKKVSDILRKAQIPFKVDDSGVSIGKRYSRNDELGTPFGVTIDFDSVKDGSVTLRERDSTQQVRGSVEDIIKAIKDITYFGVSWEEGTKNLEVFTSSQ